MKGFGIYVQNDLLEPKHHRSMGSAIWLYLWCLDKMTSISEDGIGKVLGGRPIKLEDIEGDLDISARTYTRYLKTLEESGYIHATRTPYGYVIKVTKAKKQFGKRYAKNDERYAKNVREIRQNGRNKEDSTKTIQKTTTEPSSEELKAKQEEAMWNKYADDFEEELQIDPEFKPKKPTKEKKVSDDIQSVFELFSNPAKVTWRLREIERVAAQALFDTYGLETLKKRITRIESEKKKNATDPFFPLVTTPSQLLDKMEAVERYLNI